MVTPDSAALRDMQAKIEACSQLTTCYLRKSIKTHLGDTWSGIKGPDCCPSSEGEGEGLSSTTDGGSRQVWCFHVYRIRFEVHL